MADHFAEDDEHAISITRSIIANLNLGTLNTNPNLAAAVATADGDEPAPVAPPQQWDEPLFDPREMGSIIPTDPKKPFDVRKVGYT